MPDAPHNPTAGELIAAKMSPDQRAELAERAAALGFRRTDTFYPLVALVLAERDTVALAIEMIDRLPADLRRGVGAASASLDLAAGDAAKRLKGAGEAAGSEAATRIGDATAAALRTLDSRIDATAEARISAALATHLDHAAGESRAADRAADRRRGFGLGAITALALVVAAGAAWIAWHGQRHPFGYQRMTINGQSLMVIPRNAVETCPKGRGSDKVYCIVR